MEKSNFIKVSNIIFDYIFKLDDNSILDLLNGNKNITLVENEKKSNKNKLSNKSDYSLEIKNIINKLNSFKTQEEAKEYLINQKFTVKLLKEVAKRSDIYIKSKYNKNQIINSLVEGTVGVTIKMNILMGE
ncbi:hypothetical protein [Clostridium sardiniense]|uniref:hypothetical protein n=1 Tax=Clostridium sardiniense TaxID=29369 RepID=UPI003D353DCD